jgi:RNA polymerase sigma-70 factor (ECF subfamily)
LADDLTNETFVTAADAVVGGRVADPSLPWLMTIARNKLIDHWRRQSREERSFRAVAEVPAPAEHPPTSALDEPRALEVLRALAEPHRSALTLRYVDGLSVPEIADLLGRTVHATEALLVRARATFRRSYGEGES